MTIFEDIQRGIIEEMVITKLSLPIEVPIIIDTVPHADERSEMRNIDEKAIVKTIQMALPKIITDIKMGKVNIGYDVLEKVPDLSKGEQKLARTAQGDKFSVTNKTNCVKCICSGQYDNNEFGVRIKVITVYNINGRMAENNNNVTVTDYFVGKAGKKWYEAQETLKNYGMVSGEEYHNYLNNLDKGRKKYNTAQDEYQQWVNTSGQSGEIGKGVMDRYNYLYGDYYPKQRKKEDLDKGFSIINKAERQRLGNKKNADYDLKRWNKDADSKILKKMGPNGTLRDMDRKKKAAERAKARELKRQQAPINENYYYEGGLGGHMAHPYEYSDLTFINLQELTHDLFNARVEHVTEKLDGQNIFATLDKAGEVRFGRNGSDCINGGMNLDDIMAKWSGEGKEAIQDLYSNAYKIFVDGLKNISPEFFRLNDNAQIWMNCEVINPQHPNLLPYINSKISVHSLKAYIDGTKEEVTIPEQIENEKLNYLGQIFNTNNSEYGKMQITPEIALNIIKTADKQEEDFNKMLNQIVIMAENGTPSMTIDEWKKRRFIEMCREYNCTEVFNLGPYTNLLFGRWLNGRTDGEYNKVAIKKGIAAEYTDKIEKITQEIETIEKGNGKGILKKVLEPIDNFFCMLGNVVLQNVSGYENEPKTQEVIEMLKNALKEKIIEIETLGADTDEYKKLTTQLQRIANMGEKFNALEGIVFNWRGKTMKLTGSFAPINQIMGIKRY